MQTYNVSRLPSLIKIGWDGENLWRPQAFDCSVLLANHPNGVITLWLLPEGETNAFPVALERDGNMAIWTPTSAELVVKTGQLQLMCVDGVAVGKSAVVYYRRSDSLVSGNASDTPSWAVQVVEDVQMAASHYPKIEDGYWWVWDVTNGIWVNSMVKASGEEIDPADIADAVEDYMDEHPVEAPVQSVNGKTGAVVLKTSDLQNDSEFQTAPFAVNVYEENESWHCSATPAQLVANAKNCYITVDGDDIGRYFPSMAEVAEDGSSAFLSCIIPLDAAGAGDWSFDLIAISWFDGNDVVVQVETIAASNNAPSAPGAASAGSSWEYARGDHRHPKELPTVTSTDNGKVLGVVNGAWSVKADEGSGSDPFEIPITQSGSTWTTTATAEDILANVDNCVLAQVGTGSVMYPSAYFVQGSNAQIVFSGTDSINGFIQNVTFTVTVNNGTVTLGYYRAEDELPTVSASDNGKVLGVANGTWNVVPPANALVIDFNNPYASAYDDAKAAMQGNREVYLSIPNQASNPTECIYLRANAWNATYITFGGLSSAYLPGGYFIMTYAHITSGTSNWFKWTTPFYFNPVLFQHLAPPYDNTATYSVGDYVTHGDNASQNSGVYRCTTAITVAEEWNSAHWAAVTVMGEIKRLLGE